MAFNAWEYIFAKTRPELLKSQWWIGHIPFAFELVKRLRPEMIVELGTYSGSSFAAFCQAVHILGLHAKCFGVDLWQGDIHMGKFDENIYLEISEYIKKNYPDIGVLIRSSFDEAANKFEDGSIDILHIDGTHTYEAVSGDFHTWLPKVSIKKGVVLFHDINVTRENVGPAAEFFGVRRFFDSVKDRYPHIEFDHCYGLGVLVIGREVPKDILRMINDSKDPGFHRFFEELGQTVCNRFWQQQGKRGILGGRISAKITNDIKRILYRLKSLMFNS
ncbi:MAG: class I SAM-dependent methyltransferase [Dissulfurimicrobium sp.]|uniref:class I SAM-dependent methyltransferase n=1 Tax=Dissulfurimicrobium sp. TaxID=2022436 RepID=UPI003D1055F8